MKKIIFISALALTILATGGCKKGKEEPTSIIGTWKCIGFGDAKGKLTKEIEPKDCKECYTLTFKEDGIFTGQASINSFSGEYKYDFKSSRFQFLNIKGREKGEIADGDYYLEALEKANFCQVENDKIILKYSDKKSLILNKIRGGECVYNKILGVAEIISIQDAPNNEYNCPNTPQKIKFLFTPENLEDKNKYLFPNLSDTSYIRVLSGANPPKKWVDEQGIKKNKKFKCIRMEITTGTCTPVLFRFPDIKYPKSCND